MYVCMFVVNNILEDLKSNWRVESRLFKGLINHHFVVYKDDKDQLKIFNMKNC